MKYIYRELMLRRTHGMQYAPNGYRRIEVEPTGMGKRENHVVYLEVIVTASMDSRARKPGEKIFVTFDELEAIFAR